MHHPCRSFTYLSSVLHFGFCLIVFTFEPGSVPSDGNGNPFLKHVARLSPGLAPSFLCQSVNRLDTSLVFVTRQTLGEMLYFIFFVLFQFVFIYFLRDPMTKLPLSNSRVAFDVRLVSATERGCKSVLGQISKLGKQIFSAFIVINFKKVNVTRLAGWDLKSIIRFGFVPEKK